MSLITGCPACGTTFRVVPDQLKISQGWVRCGHCAEIFDASAHLQTPLADESDGDAASLDDAAPASRFPSAEDRELPPEEPVRWPSMGTGSFRAAPPAPVSGNPPYPPFVLVRQDTSASSADADRDARTDLAGGPPPPAARPGGATDPDAAATADNAIDTGAASKSVGADKVGDRAPATPADKDANRKAERSRSIKAARRHGRSDRRSSARDPADSDSGLEVDSELEEQLQSMSFVRAAERRAVWQRRPVRLALGALGVLLVVTLAAQWLVMNRDRLAAAKPEWREVLVALCRPLGCEVRAPRQIESVVIDSSTFGRLRADAYRLAVTLKNQSALALAMPALELTLTDTQEQPVLRRVLQPADLGNRGGLLPAGGEWSGSFAVSVPSPPGASGDDAQIAARVAGYRLLAFYP